RQEIAGMLPRSEPPRIVVAAVLILLAQPMPREAASEQIPAGCSGTDLALTLIPELPDGTPAPMPTFPACSTMAYQVGTERKDNSTCCYEGGLLLLTLPDGTTLDVGPPGGVPCICNEPCGAEHAPSFVSRRVFYELPMTIPAYFSVQASARYTAGRLK